MTDQKSESFYQGPAVKLTVNIDNPEFPMIEITGITGTPLDLVPCWDTDTEETMKEISQNFELMPGDSERLRAALNSRQAFGPITANSKRSATPRPNRQQLIRQIADAIRVAGNLHSQATNYINSSQLTDGNGEVITRARVNETLYSSTQLVQNALGAALREIKSLPHDEEF